MHIPVLAKEVVDAFLENLPIVSGEPLVMLDLTFGAGGHSRFLLENISNLRLYGLDRDATVSCYAERLAEKYPNFTWINGKFSEIANIVEHYNIPKLHGILADFGVSSMQIDRGERGFSFAKPGPLLMSMGRNNLTAEQVINSYKASELLRVICEYGEERVSNAHKIVNMICTERNRSRITTTEQLAAIIANALGLRPGEKNKGATVNCCTKTFQALRIEVNQELQEIDHLLTILPQILAPGGVAQFISFHALEDRMIKRFCKKSPVSTFDSSIFDGCDEKAEFYALYGGKVIKPSYAETQRNRRARSAKLRVLKRIG